MEWIMFLVTKGPLCKPYCLIIQRVDRRDFYPHTTKGFNIPQKVKSLKGIPRIPVYETLVGFEAANPKPY